jgi:tricorn protease
MRMLTDPSIEWPQVYTDAWRIMRDWFYDPGMHQVDWKAMHDKYRGLVDHLGHRADLDYVLGELVGELNVGHTYVQSPRGLSRVDRVEVGVLGCLLVADGEVYRIDRVFAGRPWTESNRSPVLEPGAQIREGEFLLAVDGVALDTTQNPYQLLVDRAGVPVTLTVNDRPTLEGAREVEITPAASEQQLLHLDWVERNRRLVDELSGGRVGYIYVPNTSTAGFREFYQGWQSQYAKDALIVDDRYNGGGQFPDPMVLHMARPVLGLWARRHLDLSSTPTATHTGPKVMLINGRSSSGGDAFPHFFREMKLGPLMGATTWGGLVGYSYSPGFIDGGGLAVPSFGFVNSRGEWDVEYYGVAPDIEVFDDPTLIQAGREPMLEEAVSYLLEQLEKNPPTKLVEPAGPDRS